MIRYLIPRVITGITVLVVASVLIFAILRLIPGDPATALAGADATPANVAAIRHQLGLDRPVWEQYWHWLTGVLTLDFGRSYVLGGQISELVFRALTNTLVLASTALVLATVLAVAVSVISVARGRRWLDAVVAATNSSAIALPPFVTGVFVVLVFAVAIPVLPAGGIPPNGFFARPDITVQYLLLPAICLALPVWAALTRFLTEALRTELGQPYATTARALGVTQWNLVTQTALRNAMPPMVTAIGIQAGQLLGGAVLVEAVFAWPGIGQLIEQGISRRDYPLVQVLLLLSVTVFVTTQLITDIIHARLDPRIRIGGQS